MPRDKKTGRPLLAHPIVTHDNRRPLRSWRDAVATEALRARGRTGLLNGPLYVHLRFLLPRPRSRPAELRTEKQRAEWTWPWRRPDVDKCQRAVLDALKGILYHDDAQIVRIDAWKEYAADPGVEIMIERLL